MKRVILYISLLINSTAFASSDEDVVCPRIANLAEKNLGRSNANDPLESIKNELFNYIVVLENLKESITKMEEKDPGAKGTRKKNEDSYELNKGLLIQRLFPEHGDEDDNEIESFSFEYDQITLGVAYRYTSQVKKILENICNELELYAKHHGLDQKDPVGRILQDAIKNTVYNKGGGTFKKVSRCSSQPLSPNSLNILGVDEKREKLLGIYREVSIWYNTFH